MSTPTYQEMQKKWKAEERAKMFQWAKENLKDVNTEADAIRQLTRFWSAMRIWKTIYEPLYSVISQCKYEVQLTDIAKAAVAFDLNL